MAKLDGFKPEQIQAAFDKPKEPLRNNVIKKPLFNSARVVKIEAAQVGHGGEDGAENCQIRVRPLQNDGQLVGIVAECSCGQKTRIMFEYEN
ncbi:MAG TPA: hypothetical protein PKV71_15035 [Calditrichia bacterium]|nr:hypothetical protein [Calditrichota bacterium]HQU73772.1 hypothetical protein [Calditrichia bacterium]HQV33199.1 hypothetical protein [Calditrichia bacterium]